MAILSGLTVLTGCGTRLDVAELRAASGEVTLSQTSVDRLEAALADAVRPAAAVSARPDVPTIAPTYRARPGIRPRARPTAVLSARPTMEMPRTTAEQAAAPCSVSGAPVAVGQVGNFGGVTGPATAGARTAMAVWARDVSARGGLACHPVVLYQHDDGNDVSRSAATVQELAEARRAVAIVGAFVPLTITGLASAAQRHRIPVVGGDGLAVEWTRNPHRRLDHAAREPSPLQLNVLEDYKLRG